MSNSENNVFLFSELEVEKLLGYNFVCESRLIRRLIHMLNKYFVIYSLHAHLKNNYFLFSKSGVEKLLGTNFGCEMRSDQTSILILKKCFVIKKILHSPS